MRVLILGDSLMFPRHLPFETTWPVLLRDALGGADIWPRAKPRYCIKEVADEFLLFAANLTHFDAVIIQTGIVDCTPRPYPHWFYRMLEIVIPRARLRKIERFAHERLLWMYGRPWVSLRRFSEMSKEVAVNCTKANPAIKVIFVAIAPPSKALAKLLPGIVTAVSNYNKSLKIAVEQLESPSQYRLVDPYAGHDPVQVTIEDGQHMTRESHQRLAKLLAQELRGEPHAAEHKLPATANNQST